MPGLLVVGPVYVVEAFGDLLGGRAMGYYISTLVAGGLIARVGVALLSAAIGWRWALGGLALLPCVAAVLMQYTLPDVESPPKRPVERGLAAIARQLRNDKLLRATAGGCALFFSFVGVFSFIAYRLEGPPFDLSQTAVGLVFLLWGFGMVGPVAGGLTDRTGWRPVLVGALATNASALALSLPAALTTLIVAMGLMTAAMFAGSTAATLGVATASDTDRGLASAIYFSCYYFSGALAGFLPGLAWQSFEWPGVVGLGLVAVGAAIGVLTITLRKR
jgi:YNFM family putative membrane transporter